METIFRRKPYRGKSIMVSRIFDIFFKIDGTIMAIKWLKLDQISKNLYHRVPNCLGYTMVSIVFKKIHLGGNEKYFWYTADNLAISDFAKSDVFGHFWDQGYKWSTTIQLVHHDAFTPICTLSNSVSFSLKYGLSPWSLVPGFWSFILNFLRLYPSKTILATFAGKHLSASNGQYLPRTDNV